MAETDIPDCTPEPNAPPEGKQHKLTVSTQQAQDLSLTISKQHKQSIGIQRVQDVSLWVPRLLVRTLERVVAPLRRGPHPKYNHAAITRVAEELILRGADDHLDWFVERVWNECKSRGIKVPKEPLTTMLTGICRPIYVRAQSAEK